MKNLVKETHNTKHLPDFSVRTTHIEVLDGGDLDHNIEVKEFEGGNRSHAGTSIWLADSPRDDVTLFDLESGRYSLTIGRTVLFLNVDQLDAIAAAFMEGPK